MGGRGRFVHALNNAQLFVFATEACREGRRALFLWARMMGGGRNGRYWKWSFVVLLFLCLVYVFYLYRDVRSILLQKEGELESLDDLQGRLGQQLKGLSRDLCVCVCVGGSVCMCVLTCMVVGLFQ